MKVAIIGAGPAGLAAIKHCHDENIECVAFEQTGKIGGTWNYNEGTVDENGLPFHSSMYKGLTTNLPKELMEFEGFHYKDHDQSFISQEEVLEYIQQYANHFNLVPHINLFHKVECVDSIPDDKWTVQVRNLKTNDIITDTYDGVLICNGHYFDPQYPSIQGMEYFDSKSIHSHYYRKPDKYEGKRVLVIGGGPSGVDIAKIVSQVAEKVFFSFRKQSFPRSSIDKSVIKPEVAYLEDNRVVFLDETEEEIDEIIYCTGYNNVYPFLSENCQIQVDDNWVQPLYKHLINIEHPSMAIINIITHICPFPLFGLQIRFYLALLKGHFHVSKEEMYQDLMKDREERNEKGLPKRKAHLVGLQQLEFCEELAKIANIRNIPPVISTMFKYLITSHKPKNNYKIISDAEFEVIPPK